MLFSLTIVLQIFSNYIPFSILLWSFSNNIQQRRLSLISIFYCFASSFLFLLKTSSEYSFVKTEQKWWCLQKCDINQVGILFRRNSPASNGIYYISTQWWLTSLQNLQSACLIQKSLGLCTFEHMKKLHWHRYWIWID